MSFEELREIDFRNETFTASGARATLIDRDKMKRFAEELGMLIRGTKGLPIDPETWFSKLINMKDKDERSRFPTYPMVARQVALRMSKKMYPGIAQSSEDLADFYASGLIGYHGLARKEAVEMSKAPQLPDTNQVVVGSQQKQVEQQKKTHWWQRKPKDELGSEFQNQ